MRSTGPSAFTPVDFGLLAELTLAAVAAAGDPERLVGITDRIADIGGTFAASWSLATDLADEGVRAAVVGEAPPTVVAAVDLADATIDAAAAGRVFSASALYGAGAARVASDALSVLVSLSARIGGR